MSEEEAKPDEEVTQRICKKCGCEYFSMLESPIMIWFSCKDSNHTFIIKKWLKDE